MLELAGTAVNFLGVIKPDGGMEPQAEVTAIVRETIYGLTPTGVKQGDKLSPLRFCTNVEGLRTMAANLTEWADVLAAAAQNQPQIVVPGGTGGIIKPG